MTQEEFLNDIQKIYNYINERKESVNKLYNYLENKEYDKLTLIDNFASKLEIEDNIDDEIRLALITRVVNLRDDSLIQVLKKLGKNEDQIIELQEKAYLFAKDYWMDIHKELLDFIDSNKLITPFYKEIFKGVHLVGIAFSKWQSSWTKLIINTTNKELLKEHRSDEKVIEFLEKNDLYDKGHNAQIADRSYSALVKDSDGNYSSKAYIKAFKQEVTDTVDALETFIDRLVELEDNVYNQKWDYILYLQSIVKALSGDNEDQLVSLWADVDRAWMKITTPVQIGHPLEYYEDHYRKAVALEWDIRLSNPSFEKNNHRVDSIKSMFSNIFSSFEENKTYKDIYEFSYKSLDKVQLYLGRPALFFGAEFNGLFSAQVVPNDEIVSREEGKKIFAFSDEILQGSRAKPFLKLSAEIFGQEFLKEDREFLFKEDKKWHQVYDITTIGHEYGHILWCDDETESVMNKSGNFKNIEEFKATTGGLVSFFVNSEEKELSRPLFIDTIKRAVGLIGWMEVDEVQPYYCEGLIHLNGLFSSKVLTWDNTNKKLSIDMGEDKLQDLQKWYIDTYKSLALHYLDKKDATAWLNRFAVKTDKYFMPCEENINSFVKYYYERYQEIGRELDLSDSKANYIN